ncbi:DASS family sodium-coupled anion symporter [Lutimaribacter sp. EGI FJ00015]|uniref:DASS family sodium-coupled anion symporter n=1 Tax=Lutimaribacter degradans TaxID=2945989 RepID=A0ACC6A2E8_9RHOB|nr:DASS family sodium-coupled anion symporter [Lutimaribacter sp. EGI FJ00013]MCM2563759.1 DASS family sodium-coupled anion symporter [Lutimaribacter sp. EGI FJ00013]MCO0614945.1 DASS family sodium-coupled anion symporter [Lutimaribacter sp. EGI FJ00015]MCO0637575.1 DASS family sodium-coupled anion symporter [Lutimaribacter sp. EGI FJ00014]
MPADRNVHPAKRSVQRAPALRIAGLIAGPAGAALLIWLSPPEEMPVEAWRMLAITLWMVVWWLSEALPIPATALLPLVLMPLLGVQDMSDTAARYANPLIFLFLGGFLLAAAMQRVGLHRRIALRIVSIVGAAPARIVLGFMLATALLSMWISNTATAIMMFAVALSVIDFVGRQSQDDRMVRNFGIALMLAVAYSASIGGVGTLIGSPPNAMLASFVQQTYGVEISFARWMMIGLPVVTVMLPLTWLLLTRFLFPASSIAVGNADELVRQEVKSLGPMDRGERLVAIVFGTAALGWMLRDPLVRLTGLPLDDAMIGITAALVLFGLPVSRGTGRYALDWTATRDLPWGVLLLFGGGLALASGFSSSGLARIIGEGVAGFDISTVLLVLAVLVAIVYLTEITSNTASTATFLPILGAVAMGLELNPLILTVPVALGASMAFMMPVATPPNAIVFAYERMQMSDMVRAGLLMNIIAIAVAFGTFILLGPMVFGIAF